MNEYERAILRHKIEKAKIISFDIFDTLLFRKTNTPEKVFDLDILLPEGFPDFLHKEQRAGAVTVDAEGITVDFNFLAGDGSDLVFLDHFVDESPVG